MRQLRMVSLLLTVLFVSLMLCACEDSNYKQAKKLYAEGNYKEALECLDQYAEESQEKFDTEAFKMSLDCRLNMGHELYEQGEYFDALTQFKTYTLAADTLSLDKEDVSGYVYGCAYYILLNDITTTGETEYKYDSYTLSYDDLDENIMVAYQVMTHYPITYNRSSAYTDESDLWIYLTEPDAVRAVPATISWWYTKIRYDWGSDYLAREQKTLSSTSGELSPARWFSLEDGSSGKKVIGHLDNDYQKESNAEKFVPDFFNNIEKTIREKYLGIEFTDFGFKSLSEALAGN